MSGRTTAEIVADLRRFIEWYGCDPGVPMSAVDIANEAADRLAELDALYQVVWNDDPIPMTFDGTTKEYLRTVRP